MKEHLMAPEDRLYDFPLLDSLRFDSARNAYLVYFVPSDNVSDQPKEFVVLDSQGRDFSRVHAFFSLINRLINPNKEISQIVHLGGGNYTFRFTDGGHMELADVAENSVSLQVADRLKQIADTAEIAFRQATHISH